MATQFFSSFQTPAHYQPSPQKRKRSSSESNSPARGCSISGRTLKRTRARPNEELVHQYTLQKLFAAAKSTPPAVQKQASPQAQNHVQQQPNEPHRCFFSPFRRQGNVPAAPQVQPELRCEDCERGVSYQLEEDEVRCLGCHRVVCDFGCSASNGEGRLCLECARYQ